MQDETGVTTMDKARRTINVPSDSELALSIRQAAATGRPLDVAVGQATYRVDVSPTAKQRAEPTLRQLAHQLAGSLADADVPGWESSEAAERWVEDLRRSDTDSPEPSGQP